LHRQHPRLFTIFPQRRVSQFHNRRMLV
jgi:hypothetical protein